MGGSVMPRVPGILIVCSLAASSAGARDIVFSSDPLRTNLDSAGAGMDAGFVFEVGVFANNFQPAAANTSQWVENWRPAASSPYFVQDQRFSGQATVVANTAPFSVGAKGWIFGRRETAAGKDWILFRAETWNWPSADPMNPTPLDWNVKQATNVVLGQVDAGGNPFLMKSAVPLMTWTEWRSLELAGNPLNGPNDDPDFDGVPNLVEFVFASSPTRPGPPPATPLERVEDGGARYQQIRIPRRTDRAAVLTVEVSGDLVQWHSGPAHTAVVSDTPQALVVRDLVPLGPAGGRFMRLRAELPPGEE